MNVNYQKYTAVIIFLIAGSLTSNAQTYSPDEWHLGQVILNSGDTVDGSVRYDLSSDIIQVNIESRIKTYGAFKISSFLIADKITGRKRYFKSIEYAARGDYSVPVIFEMVSEGYLTLLAREHVAVRNVPGRNYDPFYDPYYGYGGYYDPYRNSRFNRTERVLEYDLFFLLPDGTVRLFKQKKNEIYEFMKDKNREIKQFINDKRLKIKKIQDLIQLVEYYNSLK